jgi:hypothetical protein
MQHAGAMRDEWFFIESGAGAERRTRTEWAAGLAVIGMGPTARTVAPVPGAPFSEFARGVYTRGMQRSVK